MPESSPRLLLAMRDASQAAQYAPYLESRGLDVRCVYSGQDLLNRLRYDSPDLVLLEMILPDGQATGFAEQFSAHHYYGPVLVTTPPHAGITGLRPGMSLLTRPFSLVRLYETIITLVGARADPHISLPESLAGEAAKTGGAPVTEKPGPVPDTAAPPAGFGDFIGTSSVMQSLYTQIQSAAHSTATVFITGESGTGKENCAQAIHKHSFCADKPFIPLNCAAIPRDLLESELFGHVRGAFTGAISDRDGAARLADGGTLFLDEIGDMDPLMQTKLLRFLQDGTFQRVGGSQLDHSSARIICATNRDPMADMRSGRMRADLFYRLHVLPVVMPPLRQRGDDVLDIAQVLLLRFAAEEKKRFRAFTADAEIILKTYDWPGNIRQLQNIIRHTVVMHDGVVLTARMLPIHLLHRAASLPVDQPGPETPKPMTLPRSLGQLDGSATVPPDPPYDPQDTLTGHAGHSPPITGYSADQNGTPPIQPLHITERQAIEQALRACGDNIPRAAALLQVSPSTLYRKKAQWDQP